LIEFSGKLNNKLVAEKLQASFYFMHKEPKEETEQNPTLEDLRRELSIYDDEPSDDSSGWDLGKEELL
jgi:dihydropteroate synthase